MKLLLVAPRHEMNDGKDSPLSAFDASIGGFEMTPSTSIATVAAMVPPGIEVSICNETTQPLDYDVEVDVVGITANVAQAQRALQIAEQFRRRGKTVVFGGAHVSLLPEMFENRCDSMVVGELEAIADIFFSDMKNRCLRPVYNGPGIEMAASPPPRWDLYPHQNLVSGVVQSSRGCPFKCNFCDVIQYLGNKQRYKTPSQVIQEIQNLYDLGFSSILIADDNFTANRKKARELLEALSEWNGTGGRDFVAFQTQMSINMAKHDDILGACHRAGIQTNFVGIETDDPVALAECDKRPNQGLNLVQLCEKSVAAGVKIEPAFIVGFDSDDLSAFERQFQFIMKLPAGSARIGPLVAPVATPLFEEMRQQGRLLVDPGSQFGAPPYHTSNFQPAQMSREQLYIGLRWLISMVYHPDNFLIRLRRIIELLAPPPWAARPAGRSRRIRELSTRLAATVLREARTLDPGLMEVVDKSFEMVRGRPEIRSAVSEILIRYLAILVNLARNGMYEADWAALSGPPFDARFKDDRLERISSWGLAHEVA